jgi:hypothetical protein
VSLLVSGSPVEVWVAVAAEFELWPDCLLVEAALFSARRLACRRSASLLPELSVTVFVLALSASSTRECL